MTKYVLHGGATSTKSRDNKRFFFEITKGLPNPVNILCVYFAKRKEFWPKLFKEEKINFSSAAPRKVFKFILAEDKMNILVKQLKEADVIYLRGGETDMLKNVLKKVKNIEKLWGGKVVAGSSAGAYVLSKYYFENDKNKVEKGLGILPIKTLCHYSAGKVRELKRLENYGEKLKIYKIPEEKFFVIKC